ncbi:hypothetical protein [Gracilibacillus sp. YIM 98692]|uniref:hypothetical protein n=1 Tax=Gracilibacillus sp. YIM 98692 TaxID=2663532 RepID=UPI0013D0A331|nr:hypothetical protein [Gracilibacillus sp. YIM 98692]
MNIDLFGKLLVLGQMVLIFIVVAGTIIWAFSKEGKKIISKQQESKNNFSASQLKVEFKNIKNWSKPRKLLLLGYILLAVYALVIPLYFEFVKPWLLENF